MSALIPRASAASCETTPARPPAPPGRERQPGQGAPAASPGDASIHGARSSRLCANPWRLATTR